jgi:DNA adenine methylase
MRYHDEPPKIGPLFPYYGSKYKQRSWIYEHFPKTDIFIDAFAGTGTISTNLPFKVQRHVLIDSNERLTTLLGCIKHEHHWLTAEISRWDYERTTYEQLKRWYLAPEFPTYPHLQQACLTYCVLSMSRGGLPSAGFSDDKRVLKDGLKAKVSQWSRHNDILDAYHEKLKNIEIIHGNALELLPKYDSPTTTYYCDPPYPLDTRTRNGAGYDDEFTTQDHAQLASVVRGLVGNVIVQSYAHDTYDALYEGWYTSDKTVIKHTSSEAIKPTAIERLYMSKPLLPNN